LAYFGITFPGTTWTYKSPSELNLDEAKLNQFVANVSGVGCIIRQGYLVKTWGAANSKDNWASASKPVTSTMLFYAVQEGLLTNVHEKINDHGYTMSTKDKPMEFYHLANMTGGYARGEVPGAAWAYNDYGIKLYMNTLFGNVYGTTPNTAATNPNRLGALGFEDGSIFQDQALYTSPRDFARIGWFWCNKGYWNGEQLLPRSYFDDFMKAHVSAGTPRTTIGGTDYLGIGTVGGGSDQTPYGLGIYGFNWWFNPNKSHWPDVPADAFQANGHFGREVMTVIPSLGLVVAWRMSAWPDSSYFQPGSASSPMNQNLKLLVEACPPVPVDSLVKDPNHPAWLKRYNGKHLFMCGPGDPENFLYRGTRNADGSRTGDQMTLINKLVGTGGQLHLLPGGQEPRRRRRLDHESVR
jgi:CubicO group peptidase (beta-lactamase class C family)